MELNRRFSVRIGCSGWQYPHWRGDLYPPDLPQSRWFAHYALIFDTVEINNSKKAKVPTKPVSARKVSGRL